MPVDESRVQSLDAPRSLARDASRTRGILAGRAAGAADGPGEPSRRSKGAPPAAPRPAPAASAPADMEAVQAPAEPLDAIQAPFAAPAAAQPMPAAAPMLPAAPEPEQSQAAPVEILADSPAKEAMPSQLRLEKKAEQADFAKPGMATQVASDPAAAPGGPGGGMGGAGYAFGGGARGQRPTRQQRRPEAKGSGEARASVGQSDAGTWVCARASLRNRREYRRA